MYYWLRIYLNSIWTLSSRSNFSFEEIWKEFFITIESQSNKIRRCWEKCEGFFFICKWQMRCKKGIVFECGDNFEWMTWSDFSLNFYSIFFFLIQLMFISCCCLLLFGLWFMTYQGICQLPTTWFHCMQILYISKYPHWQRQQIARLLNYRHLFSF